MSVSSRGDKNSENVDRVIPSKVLLVCVYDTLVLDINNDIIYDKFKGFGNIVKILIFEKSEVTKFFIEFGNVQEAVNAKTQLNFTKLYGSICKMNLYYSAFSNVDLKTQTSEGAEYSFDEPTNADFMVRYDQLTKSSPEEDTEVFDDLIMQSFQTYSPFSRSKTDTPTLLTSNIKKVQCFAEISGFDDNEVDKEIRSSINSILQSNSTESNEKLTKSQTPYKQTLSNSTIKIKDKIKSKSLALGFAYEKDLTIQNVYNLFSNFGNVSFITKKKRKFFVHFKSIQFAAITQNYLNNYRFMGNILTLDCSVSDEEARPRENQWCECIYFDASYDRFTAQKSITINAPSQTLHISSIKQNICKQNVLREIFEEHGEVEKVTILKQSAQKNMALIKFYSVEDSFRAVGCLQNAVFSGRKMQISFTKSRKN